MTKKEEEKTNKGVSQWARNKPERQYTETPANTHKTKPQSIYLPTSAKCSCSI